MAVQQILDFAGNRAENLGTGIGGEDAVNVNQLNAAVSAGTYWDLSGNALTPKQASYIIGAGGQKITGGAAATATDDFIIKSQLDGAVAIPNNRIVLGSGTGLKSDAGFTYDGDTLNVERLTGGELLRLKSGATVGDAYAQFENATGLLGWIGFGASFDTMQVVNYKNDDLNLGSNSIVRLGIKADGSIDYKAYTANESSPSIDGVGYWESGSGIFKRSSLADLQSALGAGLWSESGSDIYFNTGNVGAGITLPLASFHASDLTSITSFTGTDYGTMIIEGGNATGDFATLSFSQGISNPIAKIASYKTGSGSYLYFGTSNSYAAGITNNGLVLDYEGRVGIGTTSPGALLDVSGGTNQALYRAVNGAAQQTFSIRHDFSGGAVFDLALADGTIYFSTDGNVGQTKIGEGAAYVGGYELVVKGASYLEGNTRITASLFDNANSAGASGNTIISTGSGFNWGAYDYNNLANVPTNLGLWTVSGANIWRDSDVGIGIVPQANTKLAIRNGSGYQFPLRIYSNAGQTRFSFEEVADNAHIDLYATGTVHNVRIATSGSSYLRGGNVGIGTVTPGSLLDISGNQSQPTHVATSTIGLFLRNTSTTDGTFQSIDFYNSTGFLTARMGAKFIDQSDRDTDLFFTTRANGGNLTERMRITAAGNVGIGTVAPASILALAGNGQMNFLTGSNTSNYTVEHGVNDDGYNINILSSARGFNINNSSGTIISADQSKVVTIPNRINLDGIVYALGATSTAVQTDRIAIFDSNQRLYYKSAADLKTELNITEGVWSVNGINVYRLTGNVGIGVSTIYEPLQVSGRVFFGDSGGASRKGALISNEATYFRIDPFDYGLGQGRNLALNSSGGNVGIGTTSPTQKFDVNGAMRLRGHFYDQNNSAGNINDVLKRGASGPFWTANVIDWSAISSKPTLTQSGGNVTGTINLGTGVFTLTSPANNLWTEAVGIGVYYSSGNVGVGGVNANYRFWNDWTTSGGTKHGIFNQIVKTDSTTAYGITSYAASSGGLIIAGDFKSTSNAGSSSAIIAGRFKSEAATSGTVSDLQGIRINSPGVSGGATVTEARGMIIENQWQTGVTTPIGLQIDESHNSGNGLGYNIKSLGDDAKHLFEGYSVLGDDNTGIAQQATVVIAAATNDWGLRVVGSGAFARESFAVYSGNAASPEFIFGVTDYSGVFVSANQYGMIHNGLHDDDTKHMFVNIHGNLVCYSPKEYAFNNGTADDTRSVYRPVVATFEESGTDTNTKLDFGDFYETGSGTSNNFYHIVGSVDETIFSIWLQIKRTTTSVTHVIGSGSFYPNDFTFSIVGSADPYTFRITYGGGNDWSESFLQVHSYRVHSDGTAATIASIATSL